jgi:heterodisulfide reductase subunit A-like polyferredoxin
MEGRLLPHLEKMLGADRGAIHRVLVAPPGSQTKRTSAVTQFVEKMMIKPILVVGAGPVGMTMASELGRYGVPVRIVERPHSEPTSRKLLSCGAGLLNC